MTFQPRMYNRISGFSAVNEWHRREWNGIVADLWDVECAPAAGGFYVAEDPRLFIILDVKGGADRNIRFRQTTTLLAQDRRARLVSYIPARMELWAEMVDVTRVRHLDLHFNLEILGRRLVEDFDPQRLENPRLLFSEPRLFALAELIAAECANPQPLHDLYGDGLAMALFIDVMQLGPVRTRKRSELAAWQLRRSTEFIEENCLRAIRLEELATLTGLSQSYFSHAFKASTGLPPHQWQMRARIEKAKGMMRGADLPISVIAVETGFVDQAHFTRVFRKMVGLTPAVWAKSHSL